MVQLSTDELAAELDTCYAALLSQDKFLSHDVREKNELRAKLEQALKDLEFARAPIVSDETECNSCAIHMSSFSTLQTKYASLIDELDEVKSRPSLLGACKTCLALQKELEEKNTRIALLEKESCVAKSAECVLCKGLIDELEACRAANTRSKEENT